MLKVLNSLSVFISGDNSFKDEITALTSTGIVLLIVSPISGVISREENNSVFSNRNSLLSTCD